jgi:4-hydroxy-3-polyprenylbenzoate decarboxylase
MTKTVVIGISGASGAAIGKRIVERLAAAGSTEIHLVVSTAAERTIAHEVGLTALAELRAMAHFTHRNDAIGDSIASGSFTTSGMIVAPCSMRTLSAIAFSISDNLLVRAADVHLKERRPLVLLTRESPLHLGHIRAMLQATEMGAIIAPPVPAFYQKPESVMDIVDAIAARSIDLLRLDGAGSTAPWQGLAEA